MTATARTFEDAPGVRSQTPLLVGLIGPSGTGKTYSALRLATGIQRVRGGDIFVIDTESRRALHYAEKFNFRHVPFAAPFSSLDYLAALEHCASRGAGVIVVDSMSHEHEGQGGYLMYHEAELERLSSGDESKAKRVNFLAWAKPSAARRQLINGLLQLPVNFVFTFRSKEKLKIQAGKDPVELGWMPVAGDEFVYEMTLKLLLLPGADGLPTTTSSMIGEKQMIKIPEQFRALLAKPEQLSEDFGASLATWAAGGEAPKGDSGRKPEPKSSGEVASVVGTLIADYESCETDGEFQALEERRRAVWGESSKDDHKALVAAKSKAVDRVQAMKGAV